jgi:quinol monooxygenase YgiN
MTFVAISKVQYPEALKQQIETVGLAMIPIAQLQPGCNDVSFHQTLNKNETMMIWHWQTQQHHEACLSCSEMAKLMQQYGPLFAEASVVVSVEIYQRLGEV